MTLRLSISVALFCTTTLVGAADRPTVIDYELPDPILAIRMLDSDRLVERYQASPYAAMLADPDAEGVDALLDQLFDLASDGHGAAMRSHLASLRALDASYTMRMVEGERWPTQAFAVGVQSAAAEATLDWIIERLGDELPAAAEPLGAADASHVAGPIGLHRIGDLLLLAGTTGFFAENPQPPIPEAVAEPRPTSDEAADLTAHIDYAPMTLTLEAMRDQGMAQDAEITEAMIEQMKAITFDISLSLAPYGMAERIRMSPDNPWTALLKHPEQPAADRDLLASLPASTLWAVTWAVKPAVTAASFDIWQLPAQAYDEIDRELELLGLPGIKALVGSLDGDVLLYSTAPEIEVGIPNFTLALPTSEAVADALLDLLQSRLPGSERVDGTLTGRLWLFPLQAAYRDGQLLITSDPGGLARHEERAGGFFDQPQIVAALEHIPADALTLGLSRSDAHWARLAAVAKPVLMSQKIDHPALAALPAIGRHARFGYLYSTPEGEVGSGGVISLTPSVIGGYAGFISVMIARMNAQMRAMEPAEDFEDF